MMVSFREVYVSARPTYNELNMPKWPLGDRPQEISLGCGDGPQNEGGSTSVASNYYIHCLITKEEG
jgi:hypothetical protein